ncbi:MAG TPA: glycine zipper 2TM domain-containing protein [Sphingomonas sp.]|jgi:hypothetical protein
MLTRLTPRLLGAALMLAGAAATPALAQSSAEDARFRAAQERFDREYQIFREASDRYAQTRGPVRGGYQPPLDNRYRRAPDPYVSDYQDDGPVYDPAPDYRPGAQYRERVLSPDERVYAGNDGRYYCRRSDGTTGLIAGGAAGGILGNIIDGGRSRAVGTLLGAAGGALAGRAIEQNQQQIRCR